MAGKNFIITLKTMSKLNVHKMSEIFLFTKDVLLKQHQALVPTFRK